MTTLHEKDHRTAIESGLLDEIRKLREVNNEAFRILREIQRLSQIEHPVKAGVGYELACIDAAQVETDIAALLKGKVRWTS